MNIISFGPLNNIRRKKGLEYYPHFSDEKCKVIIAHFLYIKTMVGALLIRRLGQQR